MDPYTITWYRLLIATVFMIAFVRHRNGLHHFSRRPGNKIVLIAIAAFGLCGNYILYLMGLEFLSPSSAQVVIQIAPIFLLMGSLVIFKERFTRVQWIGLGILVFGLITFFNHRMEELLSGEGNILLGIGFIIMAAISWSSYALAQKQLLRTYPSEVVMLMIYITGVILFLPLADLGAILGLSTTQYFLLGFCAMNSIIAYGSFAEALDHLEASRVSVVLAIVPLITVGAMYLFHATIPDFIDPEPINTLSFVGAILVVMGSILCSLGRRLSAIRIRKSVL